ncbi:ABC transporter ATP-binding protein [Myxococcota bacterium]|nr:ABC transporter ATP-binding protein [Myxococcota bacterium]
MSAVPTTPPLLEVRGLRTEFRTRTGAVAVVDGISLQVDAGETVGLVGESGSGKSVTALSIMRLLPEPPARIAGGRVLLRGRDLLPLPKREMRRVRGRRIGMVFQEPMTAIDPVMRAGDQVAEGMRAHLRLSAAEARERAVDLLRQVGIPSPEERARAFPHQLSGGMKQRVMIAIALACDPELLIADEPTTALDVTIQAQILNLLRDMQAARGLGVLLVTHDLGVVAETCDRVVVLYAGRVMEEGPVDAVFRRPAHPYTVGLFRSLPRPGDLRRRLVPIPGVVPPPSLWEAGCRFRARCPLADGRCGEVPPLEPAGPGHRVACHHRERVLEGALD